MMTPGDDEQGFGHVHDQNEGHQPETPAEHPTAPQMPGHEGFAPAPFEGGYSAPIEGGWGAEAAPVAGWPDDTVAAHAAESHWAPATPESPPVVHAPGQLELGEGDRLPWLESPEGGEDYEQIDGRRVTGVVIAGLIVLAGIVGAVWWGTHHTSANAPVADGSTVAAPTTPYKVAPSDPGGKKFAGTDDTSFAVSQGKSVQEHLAGTSVAASAAAVASDAAVSKLPGEASTSTASGGEDAAWSGGVVQIGAYNSQARAATAWDSVSKAHDALTGVHHRIVSATVDGGTVWRLQALTAAGGGGALCDRLKGAGVACQVKH